MKEKFLTLLENFNWWFKYHFCYTNNPNQELKLLIRFLKDEKIYAQTIDFLLDYYDTNKLFKEIKMRLNETPIKRIEGFFIYVTTFNWDKTKEGNNFWRIFDFKWKVYCLANKDKIKVSDDLSDNISETLSYLNHQFNEETINKLRKYRSMMLT